MLIDNHQMQHLARAFGFTLTQTDHDIIEALTDFHWNCVQMRMIGWSYPIGSQTWNFRLGS
jgi:hypothetical protein